MQRSGQSSKIRRLLFDPHSASLRQAFVQGKTSLDNDNSLEVNCPCLPQGAREDSAHCSRSRTILWPVQIHTRQGAAPSRSAKQPQFAISRPASPRGGFLFRSKSYIPTAERRLRSNGKGEGAPRGKLCKKPPIFLPFRKLAAVKSAAPGMMDNIIEAKELQIERKHFYVELRENDRGKFLRITEEAHGRRNSIIVPSTGVDDFTAAISEVLANNGSTPR